MTLRRSARVSAGALDTVAAKRAKTATTNGTSSTGITGRQKAKVSKEPTTPRRKKHSRPNASQLTATPSAVRLMTVPYSTGDIDDTTPPPEVDAPVGGHAPRTRPAEPHRTNAPLLSSATSRLSTYGQDVKRASPSKLGLPQPTASTATLLEEACAHLISVDPKLKPLIERYHCRIFSQQGLAEEVDPFRSLASGIMAQQVSGQAARSIKNKFVALFNPVGNSEKNEKPSDGRNATGDRPVDGEGASNATFPTPAEVAASEISTLRMAGLSQRKAEYIKGLSEKFHSGELSTEMLVRSSDEEVLEKLTAVRGLGRWSVEMFACFALKRMDVFSTGDLGVQRGMAAYMGRNVASLKAKGGGKWKYMSEQDMIKHSAAFSPYRSLFMWYMWRVENVDVEAMQNA